MGAFDPKSRRWIAYWLKRVFCWLGKERPRRLLWRGRPIDPDSGPDELLYARWGKRHVREGRLDASVVRFPDQSVNRQKHSKPLDVLLPEPSDKSTKKRIYWGVFKFPVHAVLPSIEQDGEVICTFRVEHDPTEHNYAHSEIRVYREGQRITKKKVISKERRKQYRLAIMDRAAIVCEPLI